MSINFGYRYLFHTAGSLTCHKILQHRTTGFACSWRKSCYGFLSPLKIICPQLGVNPQSLGPMASTITTRPPRWTLKSLCFKHMEWMEFIIFIVTTFVTCLKLTTFVHRAWWIIQWYRMDTGIDSFFLHGHANPLLLPTIAGDPSVVNRRKFLES
jgi:hypothetical protein